MSARTRVISRLWAVRVQGQSVQRQRRLSPPCEDHERVAMGREVDAVAAPDATMLLLAWPRRRRPLIRGADPSEIEEAFSGWTVTDVSPSHFKAPKPIEVLLGPDEHWYRLRRAA